MSCIVLVAMMLIVQSAVSGSEDVWRASPQPADTSWYKATLTPTVNGTPMTPPSVRNLQPDGDQTRTQGLLASTTWLKGAFATEAETAANQTSPRSEDPSARMMRLGVAGSTGLVRYGMTYRLADEAFFQAPGQEQKEAWGEWQSGGVSIRSTVGQRIRLDADSAGNRLQQGYNRIDVSWNSPVWPHLGLSYIHNAASDTMDALSLFPQKSAYDRVEAVVGYGGHRWDAKLISGYGFETVEQQPWSGVRISPSASISMNYKQSQRLSMTAMGNYFTVRSSDRLVDFDMIGGKGVVSWELEPVRDWKPQLSLEGGYNLQVNRLMPSPQTENLSGLLRLVLATM